MGREPGWRRACTITDRPYAEFKQGIWSAPKGPGHTYDIPEPSRYFYARDYEILNSPSLQDLVTNGTVSHKIRC